MNLYEKLQKCRVELQNQNLKKSGYNKFAGFKYFELGDFLPAINELFNRHKLTSHFKIYGNRTKKIENFPVRVEEGYNGKKNYVVDIKNEEIHDERLAVLTIIDIENPEDKIEFSSTVEDATVKGMLPIQQLGSIHTYLRRYLYMNALEIVESDIVDGLPQNKEEPVQEKKKDPAKVELFKLVKEYDKEQVGVVAKDLGINSNTITMDQIKDLEKELKNRA